MIQVNAAQPQNDEALHPGVAKTLSK